MADVVKIYRVSVLPNTDSYVEWTECEGFRSPKHYIYNKNRSIDFAAIENTVSASSLATILAVGDCFPFPSCQCSYDPLPPTTTSTTLAPVNFVLTPYCTGSGVNGTGTINVNTFSGGNGTYQSIAIGTTAGQAFAATPINLSGATSYEFTGLFNGTYHIIVRDSLGNYTTKNTIVDCINVTSTTSTTSTTTSTTSTSTTTSTTTAAPICTYNGGSAILINTTTTTSTSTTTTAAPTSTTTTTTTAAPTTTTTTTAAPTTTTTTTAASNCILYSYTDNPANIPFDLQVRYRDCSTGDIVTRAMNELLGIDNGNGTSTYFVCVLQGSSYASPVCVQGGVEVTCPQNWDMGGSCGSGSTTTTTTAAPDYDFYEAEQYECGERNLVGTAIIAFPAGTSVNYSRFYNSDTDLGTYAYQPVDTVISGPGIIMNTTAYLTIPFACPV